MALPLHDIGYKACQIIIGILKKEEVTVKTGDNKVYMKQTILIMSASVCILYATWKRKKRRH